MKDKTQMKYKLILLASTISSHLSQNISVKTVQNQTDEHRNSENSTHKSSYSAGLGTEDDDTIHFESNFDDFMNSDDFDDLDNSENSENSVNSENTENPEFPNSRISETITDPETNIDPNSNEYYSEEVKNFEHLFSKEAKFDQKYRSDVIHELDEESIPLYREIELSTTVATTTTDSSSSDPGFDSDCVDGNLVIEIPYPNSYTGNLLAFTAGACRETSLDHYKFHYDESRKVAVLNVSIDGCDLAAALYRNPRLQQTRFLYSATANVTLGILENNFQMIFYNAIIGAECGFKRSYSVEHTYNDLKHNHHEDCEVGPNGECMVAAYDEFNFSFEEFTDDNFIEHVDFSNEAKIAGTNIYLSLVGHDLPGDKKMAVSKCYFLHRTDSYNMFDATENNCENSPIDLKVIYSQSAVKMYHRLFLLSIDTVDSYALKCDIEVCKKSNATSNCNTLAKACLDKFEPDMNRNLGPLAVESYLCDGLCDANSVCSIDENLRPECVSVQSSANYPDPDVVGCGWHLVRRKAPGEYKLHEATDDLRGSSVYGHFDNDAQSSNSFSRKFDEDNFDEYLFSTSGMEHWLIATKQSIGWNGITGDKYAGQYRGVSKSSMSSTPYGAMWFNDGVTCEQPWLSVYNHPNIVLYGECGDVDGQRGYYASQYGINVFIRSSADKECV